MPIKQCFLLQSVLIVLYMQSYSPPPPCPRFHHVQARAVFKKFDKDKSGTLSEQECLKALKKLGHAATKLDIQAFFKRTFSEAEQVW